MAAFLDGRIRFIEIPELIADALGAGARARRLDDIETCVDVDAETRRRSGSLHRRARGRGEGAA